MATKKDFEDLYRKHYTTVYYTALQLMGTKSDAEDMTQDAFITAFMKYGELQDTEAFGAWVKRIVINKCLDELRKNRPVPTDDIETELMSDVEDDKFFLQEDYIVNAEKRAIVFNIMKSVLSKKQFETIFLFYYDELTVAEIAELMEIPEGTVLSRLSVSRAKIKKGVLEYEEKNRDKLFGLIMVPFLTRLFTVDAEAYSPPDEIPPAVQESMCPDPDKPDFSSAPATDVKKGLIISGKTKLALSIVAAITVLSAGGLAIKIATDNNKEDPYEDSEQSDDPYGTAMNTEDDEDDEEENTANSTTNKEEDDGRLVLKEGDLTFEDFPDYDNDGNFCGCLRVYTNHTFQDLLLTVSHEGSATPLREYVPAGKTTCLMCYANGDDIYNSYDMNIQEIAYAADPTVEYVQEEEYKLDATANDSGLYLVQEYIGPDTEPFEEYSANFYFVFYDEFDDVMNVEVGTFPSPSAITKGYKKTGSIHFFHKELCDFDHYDVYFHSDQKKRNEIGYTNSLHVKASSPFSPVHGNEEKELFEVINLADVPLDGCFSAIGYIGDEIACTISFLKTEAMEAKEKTYISAEPDIWMEDTSLEQIERWEIYPCYVNDIDPDSKYAYDLSDRIQTEVKEQLSGTYYITLTNQADLNAKVSYYIFFYDSAERPVSVYGGSQDLNAGENRSVTLYLESEESSRIDHYRVLIRGIYDD